MTINRGILPVLVLAALAGCSEPGNETGGSERAQTGTGDSAGDDAALAELGLAFFPANHSLSRAEDGIAMADGSLLVVDQVHGLRRLFADGSSEPFGRMPQVGYRHDPSGLHGGANGMSLEPGGTHVLVADIFGGGLYRVALADGQSSKIYQHRYGINVAVRDSSGAIWFTQSAHNPADQGEALMWAAVDAPLPQGALLRIGAQDGRLATEAEVIKDGLLFANGLAIDEERGVLYLAETTGMRVTRFALDVLAGSVDAPEVVVEGVVPDNIELDDRGRLWVGAPLPNTMLIYDPDAKSVVSLLPEATDARKALQQEWVRLGEVGESRMGLLGPDAWRPFSGFVTGVIHGASDGNVYLTGLSNTLVKVPLERVP